MKKEKFTRIMASLLLLLIVGAGMVLADDPGTQVQEYSQIETVPDGVGQKEVTVDYVAVEQSETIAVPATRGNARSSVVITKWRAIAHYPYGDFNHKARTGARTQASACIDTIHAKSMHKFWGPSGGPYWGLAKSKTDGGWGCNNDTGQVWISWGNSSWIFANGTTHLAVADHKAEINGQWHNWLGETGPQETVW